MAISKIKVNSKLLYRDQERNVIMAIFQNKTISKVSYGTVALTVLRGQYKGTINFSTGEFDRLKALIDRMPEIGVQTKKGLEEKEEPEEEVEVTPEDAAE